MHLSESRKLLEEMICRLGNGIRLVIKTVAPGWNCKSKPLNIGILWGKPLHIPIFNANHVLLKLTQMCRDSESPGKVVEKAFWYGAS